MRRRGTKKHSAAARVETVVRDTLFAVTHTKKDARTRHRKRDDETNDQQRRE